MSVRKPPNPDDEKGLVLYIRTTVELHSAMVTEAEKNGYSLTRWALIFLGDKLGEHPSFPYRSFRRGTVAGSTVLFLRTDAKFKAAVRAVAASHSLADAHWGEAQFAMHFDLKPRAREAQHWIRHQSTVGGGAKRPLLE